MFSGVIADFQKIYDELHNEVSGALDHLKGLDWNIALGIEGEPIKLNLHIPPMSIAKQIEDLQNKIAQIKKLIKKKAAEIVENLKNLQAPSLYVKVPKDFLTILEFAIEVIFIMNHIPLVLDKILEMFVTLAVQLFAQFAE